MKGFSKIITLVLLLVTTVLGGILPGSAATSQPDGQRQLPGASSVAVPSVAELQKKIDEVKGSAVLDEVIRDKVLGYYQTATSYLQQAAENDRRAAEFKQAIGWAPEETERIRQQMEKISASDPDSGGDYSGLLLKELEQQLVNVQAENRELKNRHSSLVEQINSMQVRPAEIHANLAETKLRRNEIEEELRAPPFENEQLLLIQAQRAARLASKTEVVSQINMLQRELNSHDARAALALVQRDLTAYQLAGSDAEVRRLQQLLNERRGEEAAKYRAESELVQRESAGKHAAIRKAAGYNAELTRQLSELAENLKQVTLDQDSAQALLTRIDQDYQLTRQQLEIAGLRQALGEILLDQRNKLPDTSRYLQESAKRQREMITYRLEHLRVEQQLQDASDPARFDELLMPIRQDDSLSDEQRKEIETELYDLLADRQTLLRKLSASYSKYTNELAALDSDQKQLVEKIRQYKMLLDERLLWSASTSPIGLSWFADLAGSLNWLLTPSRWFSVFNTIWVQMGKIPLAVAMVLLMIVLLLWNRSAMTIRMNTIAGHIGNVMKDRFLYTAEALMYVLLWVAPWPLLMSFTAWLIARSDEADPFTIAAGNGLAIISWIYFALAIYRRLCTDRGVAAIHFGWGRRPRSVIRRNISWFTWFICTVIFIISLTEWQPDETVRDTLGRFTFIIGSLGLMVFAWRMLRPEHGAIAAVVGKNPRGWRWQLQYLWYPVMQFVPLILAALAAVGYYYTALQLETRLVLSVTMVFEATLLYFILMRWFMVATRRLELTRARARREAAVAERDHKKVAGESGEAIPDKLEIPEVTLEQVSQQSGMILRLLIGLFVVVSSGVIWYQVMPALGILDNVTLWQHLVTVNGVEQLEPVTLRTLGMALLLAAFTFILTKNLPGLLELTLLHPLSVTPGNSYAIITICRYIISIVGIVMVLNLLGINWGQLQWLVAALGLGLGFGLQEIFANFISGLILLFERPIRVGDTVTVGNVSGTVSRIRMRATTIMDWDRRELIVPNKSLITGELVNWTLSDPITRITLEIGIAYQSDVELAERVMMETIEANPSVLKEPAPMVLFLGFGDSALEFEARVFVRDLGQRLLLIHQLHMALNQALRENSIEIPFPQRDVHIRSEPADKTC